MKNILLLGDSHLATIKLAYDAAHTNYPETSVSFLGLRGKHINALNIHNGKLWVQNAAARKMIFSNRASPVIPLDLAEFDQFALFGMGLNVFRIVQMYKNYRSDEHRFQDEQAFVVSRECFGRASDGYLRMSKAVRLGELLATQLRKPVFLCPQPMPTKSLLQGEEFSHLSLGVKAGDEDSLARSFQDFATTYKFENIELLPQPPETLHSSMFTQEVFSHGSVRLTKEFDRTHPGDDHAHMNAAYGALVLKNLFARAGLS